MCQKQFIATIPVHWQMSSPQISFLICHRNILRRKIVFNQIIAPLLDNKFKLREAAKKKNRFFLGDLSQICLPTHPPQGFCEIWEHKRWIFVRPEIVIFIWETVPPPTHVWEKFPKKKTFFIGKIFFCAFPKI